MINCQDGSDERNCPKTTTTKKPDIRLDIRVYPSSGKQETEEGQDVVFQCRDEGPLRARVKWERSDGSYLPPGLKFTNKKDLNPKIMLFSLTSFLGSKDINGRLEMSNVQLGHRGSYDCKAVDYPKMPGSKVSVFLEVIRKSE